MTTPSDPGKQLVLDRYLLLERLGTGGHGTVWLAQDQRLHREVALKRIPRGSGNDREERRRAAREALAAARLSHPAIVALYEAGSDADAYYLVSEVVHGETLAQRFGAGDLSDRELLRVGVVLSDALAHAHSRGVVHRDVKPQNAIVPDEVEGPGLVKLTDFGVARIAGESPLTNTGDIIGTLAYMAPEQADGREVGAPADLYSLALTLYEGLAGYNPVRGATPAETARRLGGQVPQLQRARRDLPSMLCGAIDRALDGDPARRGSLADLREALVNALGGELDRAQPARRTTLMRRPASSDGPIRRIERLVGAVAAGVLVGVALLGHLGPASAQVTLYGALGATMAVAIAPRLGFLAVALFGICWLIVVGEPGAAVLVVAALAPLPLLLGDAPWLWSLPALAPLLGVVSLATAFPALAARAPGARRRACAGALGAWWLLLAQPLFGANLLFGPAPGTLARSRWQGSVPDAFTHALVPLASSFGALLLVAWAAAALVAPWIVRGTRWSTRALGAVLWGTLLAAATGMIAVQVASPTVGQAMIGGILGAAIAASRMTDATQMLRRAN